MRRAKPDAVNSGKQPHHHFLKDQTFPSSLSPACLYQAVKHHQRVHFSRATHGTVSTRGQSILGVVLPTRWQQCKPQLMMSVKLFSGYFLALNGSLCWQSLLVPGCLTRRGEAGSSSLQRRKASLPFSPSAAETSRGPGDSDLNAAAPR